MEPEMSKSSSLGSLTDSDSAYGTESQCSSHSQVLTRVDSSDTLLTDDTESESTASSGQNLDFGTRGKHPSASTIEVETRESHQYKDGDEDENHEQNVAFKVNKKTGDITVEIEDDKTITKFTEESQSTNVNREGVHVERGTQDIDGTEIDSVSNFNVSESDSTIHRQDDSLLEKFNEVLTSDGNHKKVCDQLVTSCVHFEGKNANKQHEDMDICTHSPEGTQKIINVKSDVSSEQKHVHDRTFKDNVKEEEQDGNIKKRSENIDYEVVNSDQKSNVECKELTDGDKLSVSKTMDKSESVSKEKSKQMSSSEICDNGSLKQRNVIADRKGNKKSHESMRKTAESCKDDKGQIVSDQVTKSSMDCTTSDNQFESHSEQMIDPSGLLNQSSKKQQSAHACSERKSEKESTFSSSSPAGSSGGKSIFKSKTESGHAKHEAKSSSSSMSSSSTASSSVKEHTKGIKPILLKQPERHSNKRPFNADGSPKCPKKVHFDSTVAVQDIGAESRYTQKLASDVLDMSSAPCVPLGVAPLCKMTELESFDADLQAAVAQEKSEPNQSDRINRQNDISRLANEHDESEFDMDETCWVSTTAQPLNTSAQPMGSNVPVHLTPCSQDSSNPKQAFSVPTPLDSLTQLTYRLTPSNLNVPSTQLPPSECHSSLPLHSPEGSTFGLSTGPSAYPVCVPVQAVGPPLGPVSEPARSVTASSTDSDWIDHGVPTGGGSGVTQRQLQGVSPTDSHHIAHTQYSHSQDDKWTQPAKSQEDRPPGESELLDQTAKHQERHQILEQHNTIGQAKISEPSSIASPLSPKPHTTGRPTHRRSRPLFSKLTNTELGLDTAGYKTSSSTRLQNNNTRESDTGDDSRGTDQWSLPVPSQTGPDNGSGQSDHVSSGVRLDLQHRKLLLPSAQSDWTNRPSSGSCLASVSNVGSALLTGQGLDNGHVSGSSITTSTQDNVSYPDRRIHLVTPAEHTVGEQATKIGPNANSSDKNVAAWDQFAKSGDGDCDQVAIVIPVSESIAVGSLQLSIKPGDKVGIKVKSTDTCTCSGTSMEGSQSVGEGLEGDQSLALSIEIHQQSASPSEIKETRDESFISESSRVDDSEQAELSSSLHVNPMELLSSAADTAIPGDPVSCQGNINLQDALPSGAVSTDSDLQKSLLSDSPDPLSCGSAANLDKTQNVEEEECNSATQADINTETAEASLNNGNITNNGNDKSYMDSTALAPLACVEDESDDQSSDIVMETGDGLEMERSEDDMDGDAVTTEPSVIMEHTDNESDTEMTCLDDIGAEGQWDSYAETDFTEDSEQTFVMNTDVDDDIMDEFLEEPVSAKVKPDNTVDIRGQSESMADKLKIISQSGVLPGRVSLKKMLEKQKCDIVQIQDLSPITENPTSPVKSETSIVTDQSHSKHAPLDTEAHPVSLEIKAVSSTITPCSSPEEQSTKSFGVVTMEIPIAISAPSQDIEDVNHHDSPIGKLSSECVLPLTTVQSQSLVAILDVAGIGEEVAMSTLERKRKRARSEEKTSSSRGVYAETELSQQDVDDAVKKLRQGPEDSLRRRPDSYHSQYPCSSGRRYDWNTHHFFPDVHDLGILFTRRRSHDSIYSQYIEEEWLHESDNDTDMKDATVETDKAIAQENQENIPPKDKMISVMDADGSSSSSDENDSPKVWRKNPLLVRRKKKSDRRLSAEIRLNAGDGEVEPETPDVGLEPGLDSPSLRRKEGSPRNQRSSRRLSNPNQNKIPRRNSDLIQEKVEKFQELQRRRKALDSTSEESIVPTRKQGRKIGHRHSDLGGYAKNGHVFDMKGRAHSQEDIRYESQQGQSQRIQSDLSGRPGHAYNAHTSPTLYKPHEPETHEPNKKPEAKSQYDFRSFELDRDRSIRQNDFYAPDQDKREPLVDYRNISSSFENIYDTVDLSINSPSMDMDVGQYMKHNMAEARRRYELYKLQKSDAAEQMGPSSVQVNIDARQLPACVTVDPTQAANISVTHSRTNPKGQLHIDSVKRRDMMPQNMLEHSAEGSEPGTPTSPVWYVPKPHQLYDIPVSEPENAQKRTLDAKSLIEEEQRKFMDYKREYVRRLSERDSTSGTSGDEQRKDMDIKHRIIPPDDYEYILRKIHHKRQDAYYEESTSQYGSRQDQPRRSEAEHLKYSILSQKEQHPHPLSNNVSSTSAVRSPTKTYLDSLNLLGVQHERSTSQLSTESSRELEQYFVVGKQRHPNVAHSLPSDKAEPAQRVVHSQQYQYHPEENKRTPSVDYKGQRPISTNVQEPQPGKSLEPHPQCPKTKEPDVIRQDTTSTVLSEVMDDEQYLSVQDKMKVFEQMRMDQKPSNLVRSASDKPRQYLHGKPPMPKREDFAPAEPSQWNYNTTYSSDNTPDVCHQPPSKDDNSQPWSHQERDRMSKTEQPDNSTQQSEKVHGQPEDLPLYDSQKEMDSETKHQDKQITPKKENYGLVLRLTPQGVASVSPSLDGHGTAASASPSVDRQTPIQTEQVQIHKTVHQKHLRPLSSSALDYNPDRRNYERDPVHGERHQNPYTGEDLGLNYNDTGSRDWRSQEDFQKLKDGPLYQEKHATPYKGQHLGRDQYGPSQTPPPSPVNMPDQHSGMKTSPSQWNPRQQNGFYPSERVSGNMMVGIPTGQPARTAQGSWDNVHQLNMHREAHREQHIFRSNSAQQQRERLDSPQHQRGHLDYRSDLSRQHQREHINSHQHHIEQLDSPLQHQKEQLDSPRQHQREKLDSPQQHQREQLDSPRQHQMKQLDSPRQPQREQLDSPRQHQKEQLDSPQHQREHLDSPRQHQMKQLDSPRQPQIEQLDSPRQPQIEQLDSPRQYQPQQHQKEQLDSTRQYQVQPYQSNSPRQHQQYTNQPISPRQQQREHYDSESQREKLYPGQHRQEILHSPDKDRSRSPQKSWSTRINEVESMRPTSHQDLPERPQEVTRSFAIVAVNDKGNDNCASQRVPFRTYEEKVQQYCQEQQEQPNSTDLPNQSMATSQYEHHVKKSQEMYRAQKHATMESSSNQLIYPPGMHKTEYVDPTFIRQRKTSSDSNQSSSIHNIQIPNRVSNSQHQAKADRPVAPEPGRSYGLQIQVGKGELNKLDSEICVKLSRSRENLSVDKPSVSVSTIKDKLFTSNGEKGSEASFKQELEQVWERHDRKVCAIQTEIFSAKETAVPSYRSYSTSSVHGGEDESDERLLNYVSYKDGHSRKRSNIYDVLTDLERTYEKLDLDNEDLLNGAERREYMSHVLSTHTPTPPPGPVHGERKYLIPEDTEPNVKRLSITNLKKLEDLQKEQDSNPGLEYAKRWLEEDKSRVIPSEQADGVFDAPVIPAPPPSESDVSVNKLSSLPRKVKDDMAYRRQNRASGSMGSHPDLPASTTMSYLAKSPTVSPSQSMESLARRSGCAPDPARDDLMYRNMQRAKSPATPDRELAAWKSPTSTDYLNERTTEPGRGRMRLRPEKQADKYHDDLAYRKLRKDVPPVVAALPDAYYKMKGLDGNLRHRSYSLDRVNGERRSREVKRVNQPLERSQSLGPTQRNPSGRRHSLSKGVSHMVDFYCQPVAHTQSAPDLTEKCIPVFGDSYNNHGDLVSDDPRYSKYAQKPKKQQTPRTVKMRHEMKSKMRQLKHSADSGYMEQSESDASHSSSGPENRSPPDASCDSDDHDLRLSDTSSDKEILKDVTKFKAQYKTTSIPVKHSSTVDAAKAFSSDALSQIKFMDDVDDQNGNNNNNKGRMTKSASSYPPAPELPHHTFVFKLPDNQHTQPKQLQYHDLAEHQTQPDKLNEATHPQQQEKYQPKFSAPNMQKSGQLEQVQDNYKHQVSHTREESKEAYINQPLQQPCPKPQLSNIDDAEPYIAGNQYSFRNQKPKTSSPPNSHLTASQLPGRPEDKFQHKQSREFIIGSQQYQQQQKSSPSFLQDIPAAASMFQARNKMQQYSPSDNQQMAASYPQESRNQQLTHRQQYSQVCHQQQDYQQPKQQNHQVPNAYQQKPQTYQQQQRGNLPPSQILSQQHQTHQHPQQQSSPQRSQPDLIQHQHNVPSHSQKIIYPQQTREQFFQQMGKPYSATQPQQSLRPNDPAHVERKQQSKPAPPTRISSLVHEPYTDNSSLSDGRRSDNLRSNIRRHPQSSNRMSWHGPVGSMPTQCPSSDYPHGSLDRNQRVEIVQPATIETRSSRDMERHIRASDRRSWHEGMADDKRVKVEFAFKAPDGTQLKKEVPKQSQVQTNPSFPVNRAAVDVSRKTAVTAQQQQPSHPSHVSEKLRQTSQQENQPSISQSPPQPTYTAPLMQARPRQQTADSKASPLIKASSEKLKSTTQVKYELPVIHSRPKNSGLGLSRSDVPTNTQKPSYTVAPITKKVVLGSTPLTDQKKSEELKKMVTSTSALSMPMTKTEISNTRPVASSDLVLPKSPKSQHIQLQDVTRVIKDPTGNKPPSQLRTTQIQVVTSTILPTEIPQTESRKLPGANTKVDPKKTTETMKPEATKPLVKVTKFDNEKNKTSSKSDKGKESNERTQESSHMMITEMSNPLKKHEVIISQKAVTSHHEKVIKTGMVPLRMPIRGTPSRPAASLLSPPSASSLSPLEIAKLSPAERGFILSPPPRRAGLDHLELSDGEMTDATDITLDGLVRSNMYRPSSPETLDFSDFGDNVSETGSDNSQRDQMKAQFLAKFRDQRLVTKSSSQSHQEIMHTSLSGKTTVTTKQSSQSQKIVTSTKTLAEDNDEPNFSFKDLVKSFEAKANPFKRISEEPKRSASTEELPRETDSLNKQENKKTQDLKQISGSDPNLFKSEGKNPSWRRF